MSASAFSFQMVGTKATNLKTAPGRLTADENSGNALSDENAVRDPKVSRVQPWHLVNAGIEIPAAKSVARQHAIVRRSRTPFEPAQLDRCRMARASSALRPLPIRALNQFGVVRIEPRDRGPRPVGCTARHLRVACFLRLSIRHMKTNFIGFRHPLQSRGPR